MLVGIDISHAPGWAADFHRKSPAGFVDTGYIGQLSALITGPLGGTVQPLELVAEQGPRREFDLVVLPMSGVDGAVWSAAECRAMEEYVGAGGAVLICGDGESASAEAGAGPLGMVGAGPVLGVPGPGSAHLLVREFTAVVAPADDATAGARTARLYRPKAVRSHDLPLRALADCAGDAVLAAGQYGAGRVVAVGNAEMFTPPFLGQEDNAGLLVALLTWLTTGEPAADAPQRALRIVDTPVTGQHGLPGDGEAESGPHVVDARPYADLVSRLADGRLPDSEIEQDAFLAEAALRFHELPRVIRHAVGQFRRAGNETGILLIKGLPVTPDLPATPPDPRRGPKIAHPVNEVWLAGFAQALGEPIAFAQEKQGQLFQNVVPTRENATNLSSESSRMLLDFHTEAAFHPFVPDYVLLHCLRPDHERRARSMSSSVRMVLPRLSLRDRAVLAEPLFRTGIDFSFGSGNGTKGNGPVLPVLSGDPFDPYLLVDPDLMVGLTAAAETALAHLYEALNAVMRWVRLDSGDLLIVDNRRAVHARSEFTARYDGRDRWLQRMCVVRDLAPSAADRRRGGRVIDTAFAL